MEDAPCPNCGYRRKRYLMASNPDAPGIGGLLRGEGDDPLMRGVVWLALLLLVFGVFVGVFALVSQVS